MGKSKGKKKSGKKKIDKNKKKVIKTNTTVVPVTTPDGSVHFDEFLKVCKEPKLPPIPVKPVEKGKQKKSKKGKGKKGSKAKKKSKAKKSIKKKGGGKKGKISSKKVVVKPDDVTPPPLNETDSYPKMFPLTMALFQPSTDNDVFADNILFPEFVVGKTETPILKDKASIQLLNVLEQQANKTVDEINKVEEKIKHLMQKGNLNDSETVEMENHTLTLRILLEDFENSLAKILRIYHSEQAETPVNRSDDVEDGDEDGWVDVNEDGAEKEESRWPHECGKVESQHDITNTAKWYEDTDLTYLLSPNSSFNKADIPVSSSLMNILNEWKNEGKKLSNNRDVRRNLVFQRLKDKFNVVLPPPKVDANKKKLKWPDCNQDEKLYSDHLDMLNAAKKLKIFQCWDQLELKYNIVHALIISLQDAIKSTSPFYYASSGVKAKFVADQSVIVQALDDIKRETSRAFAEAGLTDYWKCHPQSIRMCSPPCFDVTIRRRVKPVELVAPPDERRLTFLQRSPFITKYNCKSGVEKKISRSEDSEIEVDTIHYN